MEIAWRCHVCGAERPDSYISVFKKDTSADYDLPPGTMEMNIRYCNDRSECIKDAPNVRFDKKR